MNRFIVTLYLAGVCASAQTPSAAFEVASVRPAAPAQERELKSRPHHIHTTPGNVVMRNASMTEAIQWAYNAEFGLRLEPRKLTIDMVVVDHIEKAPTEN